MIFINITQIFFVKYSAWRVGEALLCIFNLSSKLHKPIKEGSTMNVISRQNQTPLSQGGFLVWVFLQAGGGLLKI